MLYLDPGVPNYAKRVTQQRLMHQWLTRSPPGTLRDTPRGTSSCRFDVLSLCSARDCRNQIYEIKSVCQQRARPDITHKCRDSVQPLPSMLRDDIKRPLVSRLLSNRYAYTKLFISLRMSMTQHLNMHDI